MCTSTEGRIDQKQLESVGRSCDCCHYSRKRRASGTGRARAARPGGDCRAELPVQRNQACSSKPQERDCGGRQRAFLKLPPAARGQAATALFAWTKAYVNSRAFKTAYANYRRDVIGEPRQYTVNVDEEIKKQMDDQLAGIEKIRKSADRFPPAEREKLLQSLKEQEAAARDPRGSRCSRRQWRLNVLRRSGTKRLA